MTRRLEPDDLYVRTWLDARLVIRLRHIVGWFISHIRTEALRPKGELARAGAAGD